MTVPLLIVCLLVFAAGHFWVLDRRDQRAKSDRDAEREVANRLLQRIQAPQQAVVDYAPQNKVEGPLFSNEWSEEEERLDVLLAEGEG